MTFRRIAALAASLILVAALASSCGKKNDQQAGGTASDSLLSTNPVEQPQGQIQPQTGMSAADSAAQAAQTPTPAPASTPTPSKPSTTPHKKPAPAPKPAEAPSATVAAGTAVSISIDEAISSQTAHAGDSWTGTVKEAVIVGSAAPFPAGSTVHGVIEGVQGAEKGSRAYLVLRVTSIEANGSTHEVSASADSLIAGSTRKRNLGAIAGGAAAGALLGKAIGGSGKGAVIGGILGGAAATGAVAASKGFQVEVEKGKVMTFHVDNDTKVKL